MSTPTGTAKVHGDPGRPSPVRASPLGVLEENDAFVARKVSGWNFRFKKRKGKRKSTSSHQRGGFKPFRKGSSGGKANMASQQKSGSLRPGILNKGKGKKGKEGKSKFLYPYERKRRTRKMETQAQDVRSPRREDGGAARHSADCTIYRSEQGWYSSHESSSTGQAMMAFHDAYEPHGKDAIHEKLIQADAVSEQSMTATAKHSLLATKLMAPVINPQHNPTYQTHGQLACNPAFYPGHRTYEKPHLLPSSLLQVKRQPR